MTKEKWITWGLLILTILFGIGNILFNEDFYKMSVGTVLTVLVALLISSYVSQRYNSKMAKINVCSQILSELRTLVSERDAYIINKNTDTKSLTMRLRRLDNCISILEHHTIGLLNKKDIIDLRKWAEEYGELIGNHMDNLQYLSESEKELLRPLELISDKLYEMNLSMYNV